VATGTLEDVEQDDGNGGHIMMGIQDGYGMQFLESSANISCLLTLLEKLLGMLVSFVSSKHGD